MTEWAEMLDAVECGLVVLDPQHRVTHCNAWFATASGVPASGAVGRQIGELFPDRRPRLVTAVEAAFEGAATLLSHSLHGPCFPLRNRMGGELLHDVSVQPVGHAPYAACLIQITDVTTAAVRRDRLLRRQTARYDALLQSGPDAILTLDDGGIIVQANAAAGAAFGSGPEDLAGQPARALFADSAAWDRLLDLALGGGPPSGRGERTLQPVHDAVGRLEATFACWTADGRTFVTIILRDIDERLAAEAALRGLNETLEREAAKRLTNINRLERLQRSQAVLVQELQHRTRNLLGVVSSLAASTLAGSASLEAFAERFTLRLAALSRVHGLLSRSQEQPITFAALLEMEIEAMAADRSRVRLSGPEVRLRKSTVETLTLAIHELATNALKYGAFATAEGRLTVSWMLVADGSRFEVQWREDGIQAPATSPDVPARRGYGRELIERALPYELNARTALEFGPDSLLCTIELPL